MRADGRSEMAARGETEDADALRIDAERRRRGRAQVAERPLRVLERGGMAVARAQPVLQDESGDTEAS